jgi:ABC-type transporter Mla subunit MlaD
MRIERGDVSVGFTLLAVSILVIASWLWITNPNDDYLPLFTEYDGVEGLTEQTAVRLQGFAVGRIQEIVPQTTDRGSVYFRVELRIEREFVGDSALQIPRGTVAHVRYPPVVGPPFIVLEPPQEGGPALSPGEEITGMMTRSFLDEMQTVTNQLSASVTETLLRAQALIDSVGSTMGRLDRTLSSTVEAVPEVLENLNSTVLAAAALVSAVDAELASTMPQVRESVDTATLLLEDTRRILARVEELLDSSQPRAKAVLASLDSATFILDHFIRQVAQKPMRLLTGVPAPPPMPRRGGDSIAVGGRGG